MTQIRFDPSTTAAFYTFMPGSLPRGQGGRRGMQYNPMVDILEIPPQILRSKNPDGVVVGVVGKQLIGLGVCVAGFLGALVEGYRG